MVVVRPLLAQSFRGGSGRTVLVPSGEDDVEMHRNPQTSPNISRLLRLASRQFGVFTTSQTRAHGVTRAQIRSLLERGLVQRRKRGLFVVAGSADTYERRAMEAVLSVPTRCAVSHTSAAYFHTGRTPPAQVHLTAGRNDRLHLDGVVGHRSVLPPSHVAMIGPLPVTTLARTVVDLASLGDLEHLTEFLDPLLASDRVTPSRILRTLDDIIRGPGRHGTVLLRTALAAWTEPIRPGSPAEARLLRRLTELGLTDFVTQHEVRVGERSRFIDVAWPGDLVGLEYAGTLAHNPRRWAADEVRAAELNAMGWRLREVDALDLLPGEHVLWDWLRSRLRIAA